MPRSPYALAALVSAAVPSVSPARARLRTARDGVGDGLTEAEVEDTEGRRWIVRLPLTAAAGAALEREAAMLDQLATRASTSLPFGVPRIAGSVAVPEGGRAFVVEPVPGRPLGLAHLVPGSPVVASLAIALAAVHDLDADVVAEAGLPVYDAREYRERRLGEVDRAATTGLVPSLLLTRWEHALEDVTTWQFRPSVVHGDLAADDVYVADDERVSGITRWQEAMVADPADDLAWLAAAAPTDVTDDVMTAYRQARRSAPDDRLAERAHLAGELALVRWLLHGVTRDDADVVADAAGMLRDLETSARADAGPSW